MAVANIASGQVGSAAITLSASTEQVFVFADDLLSIDIITDGAAAIWWTLDNTPAAVNGANCYYSPALPCIATQQPSTVGPTIVRIVSPGAATVRVQRTS